MKKTLFALLAGVAVMGSALAQTTTAPAKDAATLKPAVTAQAHGAGHAAMPATPAMPAMPSMGSTTATPAIPATPADAGTKAPHAAPKAGGKNAPATAPAAGGGDGKVWVNGKVFHCEGTKFYGKTKKGSYMSLADAKAQGAHVAKGQTCDK